MKRGGPLVRRTPLSRGRSGLKEWSSDLPRTTKLRPVSRKRAAMSSKRRAVVNALREIQRGRCGRCGQKTLLHGHERLGLAQGGSYLHPDVALCDPCNGAIEDDPIVSAWNGWKISSKHPHDPALEPWQARALDGTVVDFTITGASA